MTNKEKYKQAFAGLHASRKIVLEDNVMNERMKKKSRKKLVVLSACAMLILGICVTGYAVGLKTVLYNIMGWGNNASITVIQDTDDDGTEYITHEAIVNTSDYTEPVMIEDGRMYLVVNQEHKDITSDVNTETAYRYEYVDEVGNTHIFLIGLLSEQLEHYGFGEYIKDVNGDWAGGYSMRIDVKEDGSTVPWLDQAKKEMGCPW